MPSIKYNPTTNNDTIIRPLPRHSKNTNIISPIISKSTKIIGIDQVDNITIVQVPYEDKPIQKSPKLKIVIENFDKIISEFSSTPKFQPPKLQKSKTCSIIESKCILKKSASNPLDPLNKKSNLSTNQFTKSLSDMDEISSSDLKTTRKPVIKSDTFTKSSPGSHLLQLPSSAPPGVPRPPLRTRKPVEKVSTKQKYITEININTTGNAKFNRKSSFEEKSAKMASANLVKKCGEGTAAGNKLKLQRKPSFEDNSVKPTSTFMRKSLPESAKLQRKPSFEDKFVKVTSRYNNKNTVEASNTSKLQRKSSFEDNSLKKTSTYSNNKIVHEGVSRGTSNLEEKMINPSKLMSRYKEKATRTSSIPILKAKSEWDLNVCPKIKQSRIPVSLNKSLSPSIPSSLNCILDCKDRSIGELSGSEAAVNVVKDFKELQSKIMKQERVLQTDSELVKLQKKIQEQEKMLLVKSTNLKILPRNFKQIVSVKTEIKKLESTLNNPESSKEFPKLETPKNVSKNLKKYELESIKQNLKKAKELIETVQFSSCENLTSKMEKAKIEKVDSNLIEKNIKTIEIKNDGRVKTNKVENKNKSTKDYNSDYSDDSGNISNDCEIEEESINFKTSKKSEKVVNNNDSIAIVKPHLRSKVI